MCDLPSVENKMNWSNPEITMVLELSDINCLWAVRITLDRVKANISEFSGKMQDIAQRKNKSLKETNCNMRTEND